MNPELPTPLTTTALPVGDNETVEPPAVMTPPGVSVCPSMTIPLAELRVYVDWPTTRTPEGSVGCGPDGSVIIVFPVVTAPPGVSVAEPIVKAELLKSAVTLDVPTTMTPGRGSVVVSTALAPVSEALVEEVDVDVVLGSAPLITMAAPEGATEMRSPEMVVSEPGWMVCEPMTKLDVAWLRVMEFTTTGAMVVWPGEGLIVVGVAIGLAGGAELAITVSEAFGPPVARPGLLAVAGGMLRPPEVPLETGFLSVEAEGMPIGMAAVEVGCLVPWPLLSADT
jgi:hypothetical protein